MKKTEKIKKLTELANKLGYDLKDLSNQYPYFQKKMPTYGLIDRRTNRIACAYTRLEDIEKFLLKNPS